MGHFKRRRLQNATNKLFRLHYLWPIINRTCLFKYFSIVVSKFSWCLVKSLPRRNPKWTIVFKDSKMILASSACHEGRAPTKHFQESRGIKFLWGQRLYLQLELFRNFSFKTGTFKLTFPLSSASTITILHQNRVFEAAFCSDELMVIPLYSKAENWQGENMITKKY